MIRYVGEDDSDDTEPDVYAGFTQSGHYSVFARDGLDLSGIAKAVGLFDESDWDGKAMYRVTHAGIKALGEMYDVAIFVEDMPKYRETWERLKDLPGHEDYARTWFEHIPTKPKPREFLTKEKRDRIRAFVSEYFDLEKRGEYIDAMSTGIGLETYYDCIFGVRPIWFDFDKNRFGSVFYSWAQRIIEGLDELEKGEESVARGTWIEKSKWTVETADCLKDLISEAGLIEGPNFKYNINNIAIVSSDVDWPFNVYFKIEKRSGRSSSLSFSVKEGKRDELKAFLDENNIQCKLPGREGVRISIDKRLVEQHKEVFIKIAEFVKGFKKR